MPGGERLSYRILTVQRMALLAAAAMMFPSIRVMNAEACSPAPRSSCHAPDAPPHLLPPCHPPRCELAPLLPPAGALVLLAVDSPLIHNSMGAWFLLYPCLAFTLLVMLPIGWATNWLKRKCRFDFPATGATAAGVAAAGTTAAGAASAEGAAGSAGHQPGLRQRGGDEGSGSWRDGLRLKTA